MSENKIDDLFRSNGDYLSDQPHRDFDPEVFWQQLRPELARPKRKITGWWWASAAVIALALLAGLGWWVLSENRKSDARLAQKPAIVHPEIKRPPIPTSVPPEKNSAESRLVKTNPAEKVYQKPPAQGKAVPIRVESDPTPTPVLTETAVAAAGKPEHKAEPPAPEATPTVQAKPNPVYRIVHLNEIQPQKQPIAESRPQIALRIGVKGSPNPLPTESKIPIAIPINN